MVIKGNISLKIFDAFYSKILRFFQHFIVVFFFSVIKIEREEIMVIYVCKKKDLFECSYAK